MSGTIKITLEVPQIPLLSALIDSHPSKHEIIQQLLGSLSGIPQPQAPQPQAHQSQPQAPQSQSQAHPQDLVPITQRPKVIISPVLAENLTSPIPVRTDDVPLQVIEKSVLSPSAYADVMRTLFKRYPDQAFGNSQIRANCGGTSNQARLALKKLLKEGLITKFGEKIGTLYYLADGGYNPVQDPFTEIATPIKLMKPEIDWENQPLGEMSDSALARQINVAQSTVRVNRMALGIPKFNSKLSTKPPSNDINWDDQPLGQIPDEKLAQRIGKTTGTVRRHRRAREIPANRPIPQSNVIEVDPQVPSSNIIEVSPLDVPSKIDVQRPTSSDFPEVDVDKDEKTLADRDSFLKSILSK